jgi:hypothetical protein
MFATHWEISLMVMVLTPLSFVVAKFIASRSYICSGGKLLSGDGRPPSSTKWWAARRW